MYICIYIYIYIYICRMRGGACCRCVSKRLLRRSKQEGRYLRGNTIHCHFRKGPKGLLGKGTVHKIGVRYASLCFKPHCFRLFAKRLFAKWPFGPLRHSHRCRCTRSRYLVLPHLFLSCRAVLAIYDMQWYIILDVASRLVTFHRLVALCLAMLLCCFMA